MWKMKAFKIKLTLVFLILGAGCATHEKQAAESPLMQAERRIARAEKVKLNIEGQAAEYLAVAKISASEIGNARTATSPNSSRALALYNRAVADLATDLPALLRKKNNSGTLAFRDEQTGETSQLQIESGKPGEYQPTSFQQILKAASVNRKGLDEDVNRIGVGGTLVGIQQSLPTPRLQPLKGFRIPVTAVVDFPELSRAPAARLRFLDPIKVSNIDLAGNRYPLAADFSASIASYGRVNENWIGFLNMVRGERMQGGSGLLMLQPYDRTRVPVIFVHGLLSSTYVWRDVVNSLMADPELRQHYQFWGFSYPTGNPIAYSALLLRDDLRYAQQRYGFKQAILIGHSMGGILSRMQVTNSGRVIWNQAFGPKADQLYADVPDDSLVKRALIFDANPTVKRVIFICTPHRGSTLATSGIGALGMRLIRLPLKVVSAIPKICGGDARF
jgi:hypothetical protein